MAAVVVVGVMEFSAVSSVVLSNALDGVSEVVEVTGPMLNAGAVMDDSMISKELNSSPISVIIIVSVAVITINGFDRFSDLLDAEKAGKGPSTVLAAAGAAEVKKQPRPIGAKTRQIGTFGGQHCGSGWTMLVQFDET